RPIGVLTDEIDTAGNSARGIQRVVTPPGIAMHVHEHVALNPGISAVQIEAIVAGAIEYVVDDLQNRTRPVAPGKIDGVIESPGVPEIVVAENAIAAGGNAVDSMQALRSGRRWIAREHTILDNERT